MDTIEQFKEWLRKNTNLAESSIQLYGRTILNYLTIYDDEISLSNINDFVSKSFREKNCTYKKFAFRKYLEYIKKPSLYEKIVPVKTPPRKKMGKYLPKNMILKIIHNIRGDKFQDIAMLQFATGARAREIITLKEENIDFDDIGGDNVIRLRLEGKGGKERMTYIEMKYEALLQKYMAGSKGYIFLEDPARFADEAMLQRMIDTQRSYLYNRLKDSAQELGIERFGTHDFRRNVASILEKTGFRYRTIQRVLGHSDLKTTMRYFNESPEDIKEATITHQQDVS